MMRISDFYLQDPLLKAIHLRNIYGEEHAKFMVEHMVNSTQFEQQEFWQDVKNELDTK